MVSFTLPAATFVAFHKLAAPPKDDADNLYYMSSGSGSASSIEPPLYPKPPLEPVLIPPVRSYIPTCRQLLLTLH